MNRNSNDFKKLQKKWYDKLAKSGFEDIEKDEDYLKKYSTIDNVKNIQPVNETYYRLAGQFFYDYKFKTLTEKIIWKYHSEGFTYSELPDKVKKFIHIKKRMYFYIVKRLTNEMLQMYGIKHEQK